MLDRVSAALTKLLAPLTSSINNGLESDLSNKEGFQRHSKKSKEEPAPKKQDLPKTEAKPSAAPHLTLVPQPEETIKRTSGVASAITEIFSLFKDQRNLMRKWGGSKSYESSTKSKSMAQLRKGTIFDENAG